nr:cation diffusion facilitator family transporter [Miltoncostaeaceae bacterium]
HGHGHGHGHGLVDPSIARSREGVRVVGLSLVVLLATAVAQAAVLASSGSVALLADLVHNAGDALTALPLAAAFWLRSWRAERWAGFAVVLTILASGVISGAVAVERLINPQDVEDLWVLAAAGLVGFLGNEAAAVIRLRGGRRLDSAALVADGHHARTDGLVSLGVVFSALVVSLGFGLGDPIIGLVITAMILRITWQSFWTVRRAEAPHELEEPQGRDPAS